MKLALAPALARAGMTQSALADAIEVKKGFVSEIVSGKKSPSIETLTKIAQVLGVGMGELFADQPADSPQPPAPPGFADEAVPFDWAPGLQEPTEAVTLAMAPLRHAATYQLTGNLLWLALRAGDVLVVDLARKPRDGEVILVGLTDAAGFNARTVVRRFSGGLALSPEPGEDSPVLNLDTDHRAAWRGTVCASVRLSL